jgi:glycosyltransferase involved in cell wall biosynthesis
MVEYYQVADVTLIPSFLEATSLAALEAMASGSIVIASAVGGMPELIREGQTGFLVPPGDPNSLASALRRVSHLSNERREELLRNARHEVETSYSWRAVAEHVASLYHSILDHAPEIANA